MNANNYLLEYMRIHLISLEQDQTDVYEQMDKLDENSKDYRELDFEFNWLGGQIIATRHFIEIGEKNNASKE